MRVVEMTLLVYEVFVEKFRLVYLRSVVLPKCQPIGGSVEVSMRTA